jgi:hypothetical protein
MSARGSADFFEERRSITMGCTALDPNMTARDGVVFLNDRMPAGLFGGVGAGTDGDRVAWRLSPEPFWISPQTLAAIEQLGPDLLRFYRALAALYQRSARGTAPAFVAEYLDIGKPESMVKLGRQNRFKSDVPGVIRPDLILTSDGFIASELDSIPGGMGFVGAMAFAYCQLGFDTVGDVDGMLAAFAAMLAANAASRRQPPPSSSRKNRTTIAASSPGSRTRFANLALARRTCAAPKRSCSRKMRSSCGFPTAKRRRSTCSTATSSSSICSTCRSKS